MIAMGKKPDGKLVGFRGDQAGDLEMEATRRGLAYYEVMIEGGVERYRKIGKEWVCLNGSGGTKPTPRPAAVL
jgi:hypothetical protein